MYSTLVTFQPRDVQGFRILNINDDLSIVISQAPKHILIEYQSSVTGFCSVKIKKSQETQTIQTIIDNYIQELIKAILAKASNRQVRSFNDVITNGHLRVEVDSSKIKLSYSATERSFHTVSAFQQALKSIYV